MVMGLRGYLLTMTTTVGSLSTILRKSFLHPNNRDANLGFDELNGLIRGYDWEVKEGVRRM